MTNEQIIADIAGSIYGIDAVMDMVENGDDIPLHTVKGWSERSYHVKKGEHGLETRLWKKRKKKNPSTDDEEKTDDESKSDFYMAKAYLFRQDQVIPVSDTEK